MQNQIAELICIPDQSKFDNYILRLDGLDIYLNRTSASMQMGDAESKCLRLNILRQIGGWMRHRDIFYMDLYDLGMYKLYPSIGNTYKFDKPMHFNNAFPMLNNIPGKDLNTEYSAYLKTKGIVK